MNLNLFGPSSSRFIQLTTTFMLLCFHPIGQVDAGGKGKVPIYMPIPIPIPMAMGPSAGGAKFHHHHHQQQQQNDDGEGEVKKIYLLQPMPKVQPPPHSKGGFPVQTNHIHMPPPMVHQKQHQNHGSGQSSSSSYGDTHSIHSGGGGGSKQHSSSYSDMKILPIVIIPPIAPMPPIHVPTTSMSNSNSHAPRMTLTPQFNNYVVSSGTEPGGSHRSTIRGRHFTSNSYPQDEKSFSDYGASFGGSVYKESVGSRASRSSSSFKPSSRRRPQRHDEYGLAASKSQSNRYGEPFRDGSDFLGSDDWDDQYESRRSIGHQQLGRRSSQATNRYRTHHYHQPEGPASGSVRTRSSNSIRDIIDQQQAALFDDDLPDTHIGGRSSSSGSGGSGQGRLQQVECCNSGARRSAKTYSSGQQQHANGDLHLNADTEKREVQAFYDRAENYQADNYQPREAAKSHRHQADFLQPEEIDGSRGETELRHHRQAADLNNAYHDRDLIDDSVQQQHQPLLTSDRYRGSSRGRPSNGGRPLYLDEREILNDDEWWFDTIKSVSHLSPPTITTNTTNTNTTSTLANKISTNNAIVKSNATTLPPSPLSTGRNLARNVSKISLT